MISVSAFYQSASAGYPAARGFIGKYVDDGVLLGGEIGAIEEEACQDDTEK